MEKNPIYNEEFRRNTVLLANNSGKSFKEIARDLGISECMICSWMRMDDIQKLKEKLANVTEVTDIVLKKIITIFTK